MAAVEMIVGVTGDFVPGPMRCGKIGEIEHRAEMVSATGEFHRRVIGAASAMLLEYRAADSQRRAREIVKREETQRRRANAHRPAGFSLKPLILRAIRALMLDRIFLFLAVLGRLLDSG